MTQAFFYLSLAGLLWFTAGLIALLVIFGIQQSISHFYYCLEVEKKSFGVLFYVWFAVTVFLMIAPMCEMGGVWGFLTGAGIGFAGAACAFKEKTQKWVHFGGAWLAAIASVVMLWRAGLLGSYIQPALVVAIAAIGTKTVRPSLVFWLEVVVFYATLPAVMMYFANL